MDYDDLTLAIEEELTSLEYDTELKPKVIIPKLLVATQHFSTDLGLNSFRSIDALSQLLRLAINA